MGYLRVNQMSYNYEIKYSDMSIVKNIYPLTIKQALTMMQKEIIYHLTYGNKKVYVIYAEITNTDEK